MERIIGIAVLLVILIVLIAFIIIIVLTMIDPCMMFPNTPGCGHSPAVGAVFDFLRIL